jgi:hypothetical protein
MVVVAFVPFDAVAVSATGRVVSPAEKLSVLDSFGTELVAAVVHVSTYRAAPVATRVDSVVPATFGSKAVTEASVRSALRSV